MSLSIDEFNSWEFNVGTHFITYTDSYGYRELKLYEIVEINRGDNTMVISDGFDNILCGINDFKKYKYSVYNYEIARQEIIEYNKKKIISDYSEKCVAECIEALRRTDKRPKFNTNPNKNTAEWFPCDYKQPNESDWYWVYAPDDNTYNKESHYGVMFGYYNKETEEWSIGNENVKYWMEIFTVKDENFSF